MGLLMKKFLIVGLLTVIGAVASVSQANAAGNHYCINNPDDPACQGQYGNDGGDQPPPPFHHGGGGNPPPPPYDNGDGYGDQGPPRHHRRPHHDYDQSYDSFYDDNYYGDNYYDQGPVLSLHFGSNQNGRCSAIANSLRRSGFRHVNAIDCAGREFRFTARRDGRNMVIYVSSASGRIQSIRPN